MPRKLRVEFPGAIYHVMSRGDRRENIYVNDVDRQDFLKTLAEACQKTGWQVHAYCLMSNHFHLVVETPNANLVDGMSWLLSTYTIRLNHRHQLFGHVFSGRYKALLVDGNAAGYLKTVCDYVHLNPVRANLLAAQERLLGYPWSSLVWYAAAKKHRPSWMRVDRLLGEHGLQGDTPQNRQEFERRMEVRRWEQEDQPSIQAIRRGWCFGSEQFREQMIEKMDERLGEHHSGQLCMENAQSKGARIIAQELKRLGWANQELARRRKNDPEKLAIAGRLRRETTLSIKSIAVLVGLGSSKSANAKLYNWLKNNPDSSIKE